MVEEPSSPTKIIKRILKHRDKEPNEVTEQAEQSPKTPKKTVAFEVDQLQKLTEDEITLKMKDEKEKQEDIITEGKFKIDKNVEMENQETSSTLTGKLKKHITKKKIDAPKVNQASEEERSSELEEEVAKMEMIDTAEQKPELQRTASDSIK